MIHIKQSTDNQYYFIVTAGNNKVIATSETYTRLENCKKGIKALTKAVLKESKKGRPYGTH